MLESGKIYICKENIYIQIVKHHGHRTNSSNTAINAVKYHMITGPVMVHKDCQLQFWDRFGHQFEDMLNMLHTSK